MGNNAITDGAESRPKKKRWPGLVVLAVIAILIVAPIVWHKQLHDEFFPRNFGTVKEGAIYRSGQNQPHVLRRLCQELKLKTIVDLGGVKEHDRTLAQQAIADEMGVARYTFGLPGDGRGDPDKWAAVLTILADPERQPVLVHCSAGAQRTSTAVLLYRHVIEGVPIQQAYPETFDYKHKPDEWVLVAFLADHLAEIEQAYRTDTPIGAEAGDSVVDFARMFLRPPGSAEAAADR